MCKDGDQVDSLAHSCINLLPFDLCGGKSTQSEATDGTQLLSGRDLENLIEHVRGTKSFVLGVKAANQGIGLCETLLEPDKVFLVVIDVAPEPRLFGL